MINFIDDVVGVKDPAGQELTRNRAEKTIKAALFQTTPQATEMAQRYLAAEGWPNRVITLQTKRSAFRLQPGDPFLFSSVRYGISGIVYRVVSISEESLESGDITINASIDWRYLASIPIEIATPTLPIRSSEPTAVLEALTNVRVEELPYQGSGDEYLYITTMAGRLAGYEMGYAVYMSLDGVAYELLGQVPYFSVVGTLTAIYPVETYEIDDAVGIYCTIAMDADSILSITRAQMFGLINLAVVNDEIISFQTITPTETENEYHLTGVIRARYDTERAEHAIGSKIYWLGNGGGSFLTDQILVGATRYFKFIPYTSKRIGLLEDATALEITIEGRSRKPYRPTNLKCNGAGINPAYSDDCVLTWQPRVRTEGAGFGDADTVTDASPTWEGYFRVKVYMNSVLVRTTSAINALTWTYTEAMNIADGESSALLEDAVTFRLTNYRTVGSIEYESAYTELEVLLV